GRAARGPAAYAARLASANRVSLACGFTYPRTESADDAPATRLAYAHRVPHAGWPAAAGREPGGAQTARLAYANRLAHSGGLAHARPEPADNAPATGLAYAGRVSHASRLALARPEPADDTPATRVAYAGGFPHSGAKRTEEEIAASGTSENDGAACGQD